MDGKDDVFIVVDRDKSDARDSTKYFNFIRDCKEAGFVPVVTNPKFELWMLMHTADSRESVKRVVDSRNPSAQVDHEMRDAGLRKNRVDYVSLLEGLDSAMEVSVPYRLDPERLESCVGTGVPKLIESMRISDRGAWALNKDVSC